MTSSKINNGFLKVPNELADAFQLLHLSGNQWQLLWVIIRFTYGWNKPTDLISLSRFEECTGLERRNLKRNLDAMFERGIITRDGSGYITRYGIEEDCTKWDTGVGNNTSVKNDTTTSVKTDTKASVNNDTHKRQETINKYSQNSDEFRLSELLLNSIIKRNPGHKEPYLQKWASHIGRMIRLDNRDIDDIEAVIKWSQADGFWKTNILSTQKLREKFDQLKMKMDADNKMRKTSTIYTGLDEKNYNDGTW